MFLRPISSVPEPRVGECIALERVPSKHDRLVVHRIKSHGLINASWRTRNGLGSFVGPVDAIPYPRIGWESDALIARKQHGLPMSGIVGHREIGPGLWTRLGSLLGPVGAIPNPGVTEKHEESVSESSEQDRLFMFGIVGHGERISPRRTGLRELLGPISAIPYPRIIEIGVVRTAVESPDQDHLTVHGIVSHGVANSCRGDGLRKFLGPVGSVPYPRVAEITRPVLSSKQDHLPSGRIEGHRVGSSLSRAVR